MNIPVGQNNIDAMTVYRIFVGAVFAVAAYLAIDKLNSIENTFATVAKEIAKTNAQLIAVDSLGRANQIIVELQGRALEDHEARIRNGEARRRFIYPARPE